MNPQVGRSAFTQPVTVFIHSEIEREIEISIDRPINALDFSTTRKKE